MPLTHRYRRLRSGFSLLEAAIVLALATVLVLAVMPMLGGQRSAATDTAAQQSAESALGAEQQALLLGRLYDPAVPADAAALAAINPDLTFSGAPSASSGPRNASVSTAVTAGEPVVSIAVWSTDSATCWMIRRSFAAASGINPTLRAVSSSQTGCTGTATAALVDTDPAAGDTWSKPLRVP